MQACVRVQRHSKIGLPPRTFFRVVPVSVVNAGGADFCDHENVEDLYTCFRRMWKAGRLADVRRLFRVECPDENLPSAVMARLETCTTEQMQKIIYRLASAELINVHTTEKRDESGDPVNLVSCSVRQSKSNWVEYIVGDSIDMEINVQRVLSISGFDARTISRHVLSVRAVGRSRVRENTFPLYTLECQAREKRLAAAALVEKEVKIRKKQALLEAMEDERISKSRQRKQEKEAAQLAELIQRDEDYNQGDHHLFGSVTCLI